MTDGGDGVRHEEYQGSEIAIVGMACRFPGASDVDAFWRNLCGGIESLTELSDDALLRAGVDRATLRDPAFVRRVPVLDDVAGFEPSFFGYTPLEARLMDPQQRLFMECAWEAFEQAGYVPGAESHPVGVFTGAKTDTYLFNLLGSSEIRRSLDTFQIALGNDLGSMATRISYRFDLRGPSVALHTACSTSLVAVHLACQSLLLDECRMALAGGAAVNVPQSRGYVYREGGILSPDGSCRTFDARARGSSFGNGAGAVLLKRLEDAIEDGDHVWAIIRGSAINNDGASRASFTAPGVDGQTAVILEALACAGVDADSIGYVEAHGTGTELGDPIEVTALTQAFRASTDRRGFCFIGSVKSNLGHLETAAGVAGLIKAALALHHGKIPPTLHFERPNPKIDFEASPFRVATALRDWDREGGPRRAGVSSFGIGSTNAHAVLEEPPAAPESSASRPVQLLLLSARSAVALDTAAERLAERLDPADGEEGGRPALADMAYTLQVGRKGFEHRRAVLCRSAEEAAAALRGQGEGQGGARVFDEVRGPARKVAFLLPGLGDQYPGMGRHLYEREKGFREAFDRCAEAVAPILGEDLREAVFGGAEGGTGAPDLRRMLGRGSGGGTDAAGPLGRTAVAHPAIFALEYALAQLLMDWDVRPKALLGHSLGEYTAACLAGVIRPEDAVVLVAERARRVDDLPPGAMLAVPLSEGDLAPLLERHGLSLAAVNTPISTVAAGPVAAIEALEQELSEREVVHRRLRAEHAFHSREMEALSGEIAALVGGFELRPPEIPLLSNLTGTWVGDEIAEPDYWVRHSCRPVRWGDGFAALLDAGPWNLVEVGPGQGLTAFVKQHPACEEEAARHAFWCLDNHTRGDGQETLLTAVGRLWLAGHEIDWRAFSREERRRRVPLPTYPFERQRHWVDPDDRMDLGPAPSGVTLGEREALSDWFYRPVWRRLETVTKPSTGGRCLLFDDGGPLSAAVGEALERARRPVVRVRVGVGEGAAPVREGSGYVIDPGDARAYGGLLDALTKEGTSEGAADGALPATIVHLWSVAPPAGDGPLDRFREAQERGFYSLLYLAQALARRSLRGGGGDGLRITVVTCGLHDVTGDERLRPEGATVLGPVRVIPQELPGVDCRAIDFDPAEVGTGSGADPAALRELAERLVAELSDDGPDPVLALRDGARWALDFAPEPLPEEPSQPSSEATSARITAEIGGEAPLRERGVYLITGGLGGLGLTIARHLAKTLRARLVLTGRSPLPPREEWFALVEGEHADGEGASARKVRALLEIEELGGEVLAAAVDAADPEAMAELLARTRERFGTLDGVFHLAGVPGGGIIHLKTREMAERIVAPKAVGAQVLDQLLRQAPPQERPRFLVLFSSVASILGEFGQVDYCGANAFLDALARRNAHDPDAPRTLVLDWDIWREVGLAVDTDVPEHLEAWREEMLEKAIAPEEGIVALERALARGLGGGDCDGAAGTRPPQLVVSTQELHGRIELGRSLTGQSFLDELERTRTGGAPGAATGTEAARLSRSGESGRPGAGVRPAVDGVVTERDVAAVWERVLDVPRVGVDDNFFELGGNSLLGLQLVSELNRELGLDLAPVSLFDAPSVGALVRLINPEAGGGDGERAERERLTERRRRLRLGGAGDRGDRDVAIVGMTCRFPGAPGVDRLWQNLLDGVESVTFFSDEELIEAGVDPALLADPRYVRAGSILDEVDRFDAGLFGYSPREAEVMDPQHRIFLECAWEVLERAGYDPSTYPGSIGVYAGSNLSTYLLGLHSDPEVRSSVNMLQAILGNDRDSLTTAVSYKLDLRGPSVAVQTFCSTSLVAVHMAVQSLRAGECDMALAGGIRVVVPTRQGYLYERGGLAPADGHSRPFDARADGSVLGNGVGIVVVKRLADALEDGDHVHAVIKGSAINNDGSLKAGYTAPSVEGQAEAVAAAYEDAGIDPSTIGYVEAHGSATELGDPIEVAALSRAYRRWTDAAGFCAIGSIKSNFGHLDRAAGVAGLTKAVLALEREEIPPTVHFEEPNPEIDFEHSPFRVAAERTPWKSNGSPRRAAVNSLGMGGTNVHVVLEEAPPPAEPDPSRTWQLLVLSARSEPALDRLAADLADHLGGASDAELADAAFTLKAGRKSLEHRRTVVCRDAAQAVAGLRGERGGRTISGYREAGSRPVAFLLPGLGAHHVGMGRGLYEQEPAFRDALDRCATLLEPRLGVDLRTLIYPEGHGDTDAGTGPDGSTSPDGGAPAVDLRRMLGRGDDREDPAAARLDRTRHAHPALFAVEYALARLWMEWGVQPAAMIGYSLGEYTAACLAGVLSLEDATALVAERARLVDELPEGAVVAVGLGEEALGPLLTGGVSLMAVNGPEQTVASGPAEAIAALEEKLTGREVVFRRLGATHPFHSEMLEPVVEPLVALARSMELRPPRIPYLSNLTGTWIRDEEATDPEYWGRHLCRPVRFSEGLVTLAGGEGEPLLLEVGPGRTLTSVALQHPGLAGRDVVASLGHPYEVQPDGANVLDALGRLWLLGGAPDWRGFYRHERRRRVILPTYPFERRRYWIDAQAARSGTARAAGAGVFETSWKRAPRALPPEAGAAPPEHCLVLADDRGVGEVLARRLSADGGRVTLLEAGTELDLGDPVRPRVDPSRPDHVAELLDALDVLPDRFVHLEALGRAGRGDQTDRASVVRLVAALAARRGATTRVQVVTAGLQEVRGDDRPDPERAAFLGVAAELAREVPGVSCQLVDLPALDGAGGGGGEPEDLESPAAQILAEMAADRPEPLVAYRGGRRWVPCLEPVPAGAVRLPEDRAFLVIGGLAGAGFAYARRLAAVPGARLVLAEAPGFPAREEWSAWHEGEVAEGVIGRRVERAEELAATAAALELVTLDAGADRDGDGTAREEAERLVATAEERCGPLAGVVLAIGADGSIETGDGLGALALARSLDAALAERRLAVAHLVTNVADASGDPAVGVALDAWATASGDAPVHTPGEPPVKAGRCWSSVAWDLAEPPAGQQGVDGLVDRLLGAPGGSALVASDQGLADRWHRATAPPREGSARQAAAVGSYPRPGLRTDYVVPRSETERRIADLWQDLLGLEAVGVHDSFLDLGGDSLLATRLIARMRDAFDLDLPVRVFFERSTVAELSEAVEEARRREESPSADKGALSDAESEALIERIQEMSEEELERELARLEAEE